MQVGCILDKQGKLKIGNDGKHNKNGVYIVYILNYQRISKIY